MIIIKPTTLKNVDVFRDGELLVQGISLHLAKDGYEYDEIITTTTQDQLTVTNELLAEAVRLLRKYKSFDDKSSHPFSAMDNTGQKAFDFLKKFDE